MTCKSTIVSRYGAATPTSPGPRAKIAPWVHGDSSLNMILTLTLAHSGNSTNAVALAPTLTLTQALTLILNIALTPILAITLALTLALTLVLIYTPRAPILRIKQTT